MLGLDPSTQAIRHGGMNPAGIIAVCIMASGPFGTLYIGVTSNLVARVYQHREGLAPGFTKRYACTNLVWFERHELIRAAIRREKSLKRWRRVWKTDLIEQANPHWRDLFNDIALG